MANSGGKIYQFKIEKLCDKTYFRRLAAAVAAAAVRAAAAAAAVRAAVRAAAAAV